MVMPMNVGRDAWPLPGDTGSVVTLQVLTESAAAMPAGLSCHISLLRGFPDHVLPHLNEGRGGGFARAGVFSLARMGAVVRSIAVT
jgi:hypothetical protein